MAFLLWQRSSTSPIAFVVIDDVDVRRSNGAGVLEVIVLGLVTSDEHRVWAETGKRCTDPNTSSTHSTFRLYNVWPLFWSWLLLIVQPERSGFDFHTSVDVTSSSTSLRTGLLLRIFLHSLKRGLLLHLSSQLEEGERGRDSAKEKDEENDDNSHTDVDG